MLISEVEKRTGLKKDNIRYYEKERLLSPKRDKYNDYREYSEEDIEQLMRIKLLRSLGVSIKHIKAMTEHSENLGQILSDRTDEIRMEKKNLDHILEIVNKMTSDELEFYDIDSEFVKKHQDGFDDEMKRVFQKDTAKFLLNMDEFYNVVMWISILGIAMMYLTVTRPVLWGLNEKHSVLLMLAAVVFLLVVINVSLNTSNIIALSFSWLCVTIFIFPVLTVTVLNSVLHYGASGMGSEAMLQFMFSFTLPWVLFVCLLRVSASKKRTYFTDKRRAVLTILIFNLIVFLVSYAVFGNLKAVVAETLLRVGVTKYAVQIWRLTADKENDYNLYNAITTSLKILCSFGVR